MQKELLGLKAEHTSLSTKLRQSHTTDRELLHKVGALCTRLDRPITSLAVPRLFGRRQATDGLAALHGPAAAAPGGPSADPRCKTNAAHRAPASSSARKSRSSYPSRSSTWPPSSSRTASRRRYGSRSSPAMFRPTKTTWMICLPRWARHCLL